MTNIGSMIPSFSGLQVVPAGENHFNGLPDAEMLMQPLNQNNREWQYVQLKPGVNETDLAASKF